MILRIFDDLSDGILDYVNVERRASKVCLGAGGVASTSAKRRNGNFF